MRSGVKENKNIFHKTKELKFALIIGVCFQDGGWSWFWLFWVINYINLEMSCATCAADLWSFRTNYRSLFREKSENFGFIQLSASLNSRKTSPIELSYVRTRRRQEEATEGSEEGRKSENLSMFVILLCSSRDSCRKWTRKTWSSSSNRRSSRRSSTRWRRRRLARVHWRPAASKSLARSNHISGCDLVNLLISGQCADSSFFLLFPNLL